MRIAVLGQIAGPIGGQSRLTEAFHLGSEARTDFFEFWGHKTAMGPLRMLAQMLRGFWLALTGKTNAAYIAMSRSNFGMLRDLALLLPFILMRVPVVAHVHGADFEAFFLEQTRFRRLKDFYLRNVDRFIFVNEVFVPEDTVVADRSTFVRNPIPDFAVKALSQNLGRTTRAGRRTFGFISTFARAKGIELFLKAAKRYGDQADFVVAGGPSIEDAAYGEGIIEQIDAIPQIEYLGYLTDPTPFYNRCDAMIFPTRFASETSSLVVIEALATRTHPIVRRHNRLTDIFGAAPVSWFDDAADLDQQIEAALARPEAELEAQHDQARPWVQSYFPTEAQWVTSVEAIVKEATG